MRSGLAGRSPGSRQGLVWDHESPERQRRDWLHAVRTSETTASRPKKRKVGDIGLEPMTPSLSS